MRYVAGRLRDSGWKVALQEVPLRLPSERAQALLAIGSLGQLEPLRDFRVATYSAQGRGSGPAAPVDEGCARSDFGALEPGSVAVAATGGCLNFEKARNAARAGALALIVGGDFGRRGVPSATLAFPARLPVLLVGRRASGALVPGVEVSLRVNTELARGTTQNVIAEAGEGKRVVMAGAHLDSVPDGPGINDNASGVAVLLEAADALGSQPKERFRLAFWAAEELGLTGSRHYVRALSREEQDQIAAYLNFDMVGSLNAVPAVYSDADERLARVLRDAHPGRETGVRVAGASDHAPFADAGIAVGGLYTGSEEPGPGGRPSDPCYHRACDSLENVDRRVLVRMARAMVTALKGLSEVEDQP